MSSINEVAKDYAEARSDARRKHRLIALLSCLVVLATAFALMAPAISASKSDLENAGVGLSNAVEPESLEDVAAEADDGAGAADADDAAGGAGAAAEAPAEDPAADTPAEPAAPEQDPAAEPEDETLFPAQTFTGEVKNKKDQVVFSVLVDAPEGAFPEGTTMEINTLSKQDQKEAQQAAAEAVEEATDNKINRMESVDITFRDAEGNEVEPQQTVSMKFSSVLMGKDFEPKVVHQDDQGEATVVDPLNNKELKKRDQQLEENELMVDVDAFSVYTIVYTVDFHYSVDGQSYDAQTQGGDTTSLKALLTDLGVAKDDKETVPDELAMFMESIANVEFSAPELVAVAAVDHDTTTGDLKVELGLEPEYAANLTEADIAKMNAKRLDAGDWALVSLKPFESEETLTVTMQDGQVFVVKVTDEQISKTVISASGDTYEITVTYGPEAGIPDGAELKVREIAEGDEDYESDIDRANQVLRKEADAAVANPALFDIKIVHDGSEVEPREGASVHVDIKLAKSVFGESEEDSANGGLWLNGEQIAGSGEDSEKSYNVVHLPAGQDARLIDAVHEDSEETGGVQLSFDTDSFSDFLLDESTNAFEKLPTTIYVGDTIYIYNQNHRDVYDGGGVVTVTRPANNDSCRIVQAVREGDFGINGKWIHVKPARQETEVPPLADGVVSNASIGVSLNLFDYDTNKVLDDYFNEFNHTRDPYNVTYKNYGINNNHALKFWGSGVGNWGANQGNVAGIKLKYNQYNDGATTGIVQKRLDGGYPKLADGEENLSYLFNPSDDGTNRKAYVGADRLFQQDADGYYIYDSNKNYAWFNPDTNSFEVYNRTYEQKSSGEQTQGTNGKAIGFFPFHKWDDQYDLYVNWNKNLNHHFGMSMSVEFSLPKDPKAVKDKNNNDIVFEFSGDDDMWVFIDGQLAMDIGGIHQPVSGSINFTQKTVKVGDTTQNYNFPNSLYDGQKHTLQVFYIERGGCDSNCMIKFNLTQYGHVEFDKADKDNQNDKLQGAVFGIYKDAACTQPLMENLKDNTSRAYVAESDANGHVKFSDIPLGSYYMKELHAPEGYPLDGTIHPVQVYLEGQEVKAKIDGAAVGADNGVTILNKKPSPITLGLKKDWQDADGHSISAPVDVTATFEIKRIRTYETYTEQQIEGQGRESSHLTVGWVHNGQTHVYNEYDLIAGSQATVSWSYVNGYEGSKACIENGNRIDKGYTTGDVVSEGLTMPAAGQSATFYIVDDSETGEAIKNINVAGQQFYGNSGGGVIHSFTTVVEPDPGFSYTGEHVAQNQVTLPIDSNVWQYDFRNLPTFEKVGDTVYNYSYYLEEVSSTSPAGTTIVYQDINENVINAPTGAETSQPGTQTIINKVPFGYLQIQKKVTYNGSDQNLTSAQKSKLAGVYKFKIYTKEGCAEEDAVKGSNGEDLEVAITIGSDGQAVSSDAIKLIAGTYWIKEVESSNPAMFPTDNPVEVTVTKDNTSTNAAIQTLTNNYDENNGPDKIALDIEKKFSGLGSSLQVPSSFQVVLQYTVGDQTKTVTLGNTELATGDNGEKITWTGNDLTWHWRVSNIPSEATDFKIKEQNYNTVKGYQWIKATLNNADITSSVDSWHDLVVTAPAATLSDVTHDRRTSDSGNNTEFYLEDDDILLTKLTANQGTLVISKHPLNMAERDAVQNGWPSNGGFKKPPHYFSIEEHPNGFSYGNKTITFGEKNGKATVKFTQNASAQEVVFAVTYSSQDARNNANLVNEYAEVPMTIDIVKVDKDNVTTKLSGAVFTLRQLADKGPTDNGTFKTLDGTDPTDSTPTGADGKTSFANLTHGFYEVTEKTAPAGYVLNEQTTFYFKIDGGVVTWLQKGDGKPSTWQEATHQEGDMVSFAAAQEAADGADAKNATFTVGDEPGKPLPNTGGPGTTLLYGLGLMLITLAATVILRRRTA